MKYIKRFKNFINGFLQKLGLLKREYNKIFSVNESFTIVDLEEEKPDIIRRFGNDIYNELEYYYNTNISDYVKERILKFGYDIIKPNYVANFLESLKFFSNIKVTGKGIIYKGSELVGYESLDGGCEGNIIKLSENLILKTFKRVQNYWFVEYLKQNPIDCCRVILDVVYNSKGEIIGFISENLDVKSGEVYEDLEQVIKKYLDKYLEKIRYKKVYIEFNNKDSENVIGYIWHHAPFSLLQYVLYHKPDFDFSEMELDIKMSGFEKEYINVLNILHKMNSLNIIAQDLKGENFGIDMNGNVVISDIGKYFDKF